MRCLPRLLVGVLTLLAAAPFVPSADAFKYGWSARPAGPTAVTFDSSETCNPNGDFMDEPIRAFRYRNSETPSKLKVQANFGHVQLSRRMIGDDLYSLKRESTLAVAEPSKYRGCGGGADGIYRGHNKAPTGGYPGSYPPPDDGAATYQNKEFLQSPYYKNGLVYALLHNEFHGGNFVGPTFSPPWCTMLPEQNHCWYASITMATSDASQPPESTGGISSPFDKIGSWYVQPSDYLVATIPYRYELNWGRNGYSTFTNIVKGERQENGQDAYYFMSNAAAPRLPQKNGTCLLRTTNLASASAWRAWDGDGFDATVNSNPYSANPPSQAGHICEPVSPEALTMGVRNLTFNRELGKYMAVGTGGGPGGESAVLYSLSDDLINWSPAQVIFEEENPNPATGCPDPAAAYPTLLDPDDPAQSANPDTGANTNFDHPDRMTDIFHRRPEQAPYPSCAHGEDDGSDVVHTPIELKQRLTTVSGATLEEQPSGYDKVQGSFVYHYSGFDYDPDSSDKSMYALTWGGQASWGYGRLGSTNVGTLGTPLDWQNGDDVWYGTAFYLPPSFLTDNSAAHLMRWETGTGEYGGIALRPSDKLQLIRSPGNTPVISAEFTPPLKRWFWIEVHQKLSTTSGAEALNEVYVDGKLVGTSTSANRTDAAPVKRVNYGFVSNNLPNGTISTMWIDRSSILGGERGAVIGSGFFQAARAPVGVRASAPASGQIRLAWNGPAAGDPPVTGYRIYERQADGTWDPTNVDQTALFNITETGLAPCSTHTYRITAYRSFTDPEPANPTTTESVPTAPVTATSGGC